jgi:tetratricopeptide (TPR) repeat protein
MSAANAIPHAALPKIFAVLAVLAVMAAVLILGQDGEDRVRQLVADKELGSALETIESMPSNMAVSERGFADRVELNLSLGRIDEALQLVETVLARDPETLWARDRKDEIVSGIGSLEDRIAWANENFVRSPNADDFRYLLGTAVMAGDLSREAELIDQAISSGFAEPRDIERLGLIRATQGEHQEAIDLLEEVVTGENASQRARLTLFALMTEIGQVERALEIAMATGLDLSDPSSVKLYANQSRGPAVEAMEQIISDRR